MVNSDLAAEKQIRLVRHQNSVYHLGALRLYGQISFVWWKTWLPVFPRAKIIVHVRVKESVASFVELAKNGSHFLSETIKRENGD